MAGVVQAPITIEVSETELEVDAVELALAMCPPGEAIEIHARHCECVPCSCIPRVIVKPHPS